MKNYLLQELFVSMSVVFILLVPALSSAHIHLGYNMATVKQENSGHHIEKREPVTLTTLGTILSPILAPLAPIIGLFTTIKAPLIAILTPLLPFIIGNQSHVTFAQWALSVS